tara:strand:- start:303 stop:623 length:321 start_codon:yes stop_codon:yes gene_type:complete
MNMNEAAPAAAVVGKVALQTGKVVAQGGKKAAKGAKGVIGAWVAGYGKSSFKEVEESLKDELLSTARKKHKKAKSFKQWRRDSEQTPLKKGEVRKLVNGKWVSNKK